ncbi:MAG: phosphatidylserine decarboxylase [Bryobacterales bacterium]
MVKDGIYYGVGLGAAGLLLSVVFHPAWGAPFFLLAAFCLYFFRDPERAIPAGDVVVSPADGKVVHMRPTPGGGVRISIFLNIFNVHVNRSPIGGRVTGVEYKTGSYLMAHKELASDENEQNTLTIDPDRPGMQPVIVKQIAGLVARRIVCYKKIGDRVEKGERFGLIKFGSRADVFLGPEWQPTIQVGEKVAGGSSILAKLRNPPAGGV